MFSTFSSVMRLVLQFLNYKFVFLGVPFSIWNLVCFGCLLSILMYFLVRVFE